MRPRHHDPQATIRGLASGGRRGSVGDFWPARWRWSPWQAPERPPGWLRPRPPPGERRRQRRSPRRRPRRPRTSGPMSWSSTRACPRARSRRRPTPSGPSRSTTRWAATGTPCCSSRACTAPTSKPLQIKVGYYTEVAGLGASPGEVQINGKVEVRNRCFDEDPEFTGCFALNNFWRGVSNLTINVNGTGQDGCSASANFWAVSQAVSMRRVEVTGGNLSLMDYCTGPSFASGGFIADSKAGAAHQRFAAAVVRAQQRGRRLDERRVEPGLLRT